MVERILISNGYLNMKLKRPRQWPKWVSWSTLSNLAIAFKGAQAESVPPSALAGMFLLPKWEAEESWGRGGCELGRVRSRG